LPEVGRTPLEEMIERLSGFQQIDELLLETDGDPRALMGAIMEGIPYTELEKRPLEFKCRCSDAGVLAGLATIGREEIAAMISENNLIEVDCDFCGKGYRITPAQLKSLLVKV